MSHLGQHAGSLGAAHDRDARIGPHEQEGGAEGSPTHAVVASPKAASNNERDLWHLQILSESFPMQPLLPGDRFALPNNLHVTQSVLLQSVLTCVYLTLATIIITAASPMEDTSYRAPGILFKI